MLEAGLIGFGGRPERDPGVAQRPLPQRGVVHLPWRKKSDVSPARQVFADPPLLQYRDLVPEGDGVEGCLQANGTGAQHRDAERLQGRLSKIQNVTESSAMIQQQSEEGSQQLPVAWVVIR